MIRSGAEQLTRDILKLGLHGDQEPAIVDLLKQVAKLRVEEASWGNPNGVAERPVNSVEKMVRVHQSTFENRIGGRLPVKHPLFAWLVEHASDILNRLLVGRDGNAAVQRLKGKRCEQYVLEFGSAVMFRVRGKVEGACVSERWYSGFSLGKRLGTEEHA